MKRRPVSPFSLSFLDVMFCGFGAVVLLVLILNADTVKARDAIFSDLRADVVRLEKSAISGRENLVIARNSLASVNDELATTRGETERVLQRLERLQREIAHMQQETQASRTHINRLSSDLKNLDEENKRLGARAPAEQEQGEQVHRVVGEGQRQYLTGLKVGGKRILILVDASASMLDESIVNVIRRRNMSAAQKRQSPKWQRALATTEWLLANLPADAKFQLYSFDTHVSATLQSSHGQWLQASSSDSVAGAVRGLLNTVPAGGTSLYRAFAAASKLRPPPDNILLVTDGLPTPGRSKPAGTTVSADQRLKHFSQAVSVLPAGVPVNTILLPMEGDAWAAAAFWKLALSTRGSFITPASDWP